MSNPARTRKRHQQPFPSVSLYDVPLLAVNQSQCIELIMDGLDSGGGGWCTTIHLSMLHQITREPEIRKLVENSTFCIADGISLVWASRLRGTPLPERVCGCDLIYSLSEAAAHRGRSIFLLGGNRDTAGEAAEILKQRYKNLKIAGTYYPPMGFEQNREHIEAITESLRSTQPDIIYVALGFPKQEQLIAKLRHLCPDAWWMGVGVSFSYVTEEFKRAPLWVQKYGLETFYRVVLEPRRLAKRYLLDNPPFAARLLISSWLEGFSLKYRSPSSTDHF